MRAPPHRLCTLALSSCVAHLPYTLLTLIKCVYSEKMIKAVNLSLLACASHTDRPVWMDRVLIKDIVSYPDLLFVLPHPFASIAGAALLSPVAHCLFCSCVQLRNTHNKKKGSRQVSDVWPVWKLDLWNVAYSAQLITPVPFTYQNQSMKWNFNVFRKFSFFECNWEIKF